MSKRTGWYPTERDIEYLIGLKGLTVVSHEIGKISKDLYLGHECLDQVILGLRYSIELNVNKVQFPF